MIEVSGLTKRYGATLALRGASFAIESGRIVGLLGPNGAGKTTTMKILTGYLLPTSGSARVAGFDVVADPLEVQRRIGYLPENAPLYLEMIARDYLHFVARMRGLVGRGEAERAIARVAELCAIEDVLGRPIGQLSKGYRQRVGLAAALLHDPEILILDEPTTGLDPNQIVEVRDLIRRMGEAKTIVLSTHILPEVEATCSRVVILIDGQVRADGALDELTRGRAQVVTCAPGDIALGREVLLAVEGVTGVDAVAGEDGFHTYRLTLAGRDEIGERVAAAIAARGWPLRALRRDDRTLEQVFRELSGGALAGASAAREGRP